MASNGVILVFLFLYIFLIFYVKKTTCIGSIHGEDRSSFDHQAQTLAVVTFEERKIIQRRKLPGKKNPSQLHIDDIYKNNSKCRVPHKSRSPDEINASFKDLNSVDISDSHKPLSEHPTSHQELLESSSVFYRTVHEEVANQSSDRVKSLHHKSSQESQHTVQRPEKHSASTIKRLHQSSKQQEPVTVKPSYQVPAKHRSGTVKSSHQEPNKYRFSKVKPLHQKSAKYTHRLAKQKHHIRGTSSIFPQIKSKVFQRKISKIKKRVSTCKSINKTEYFKKLISQYKVCEVKRISRQLEKKGKAKKKQTASKFSPKLDKTVYFEYLFKRFKICFRVPRRLPRTKLCDAIWKCLYAGEISKTAVIMKGPFRPRYPSVIPCDKIGIGKFDAKNMSQDISIPIRSLKELEEWIPIENDLRIATVPLAKKRTKDSSTPQTLYCHDMCGGYLQDRFVNGCNESDAYRFYHWQYIDIFVYFSHHFITIPPTTLTNAAHTHGVQMLGTLITEWDDGKKRCQKFLETDESYKAFTDKLVQISQHYNFEGWLVNIENVIQTDQVQRLCDFVSYLTQEMHKKIPGSKVIWYDSVIKDGKLRWQNALNKENSLFFNVSDGIFLNYNWNDKKLEQSRAMAEEKNRTMEVFVGIDVFGRGCLGGGGWNTVQALAAVRRFNMSAAIFAPGWVYETQGKENYTKNENMFWSKLDHLLPGCEYCEPYLSTSFCQGFGTKDYFQGEVMKDEPWHNMTRQQLQPTYTNTQFFRQDLVFEPNMEICTEDAYIGGSCIILEGKPSPSGLPLIFKLFDTCISDIGEPLMVSYTFKTNKGTTCDIFLELETLSQNVKGSLIFRNDSRPTLSPSSKVFLNLSTEEINEKLCQDGEDFKMPKSNWTTRYFYVDAESIKGKQIKLVSIGLQAVNVHVKQSVLLGQVQIIPLSLLNRKNLTCIKSRPNVIPTTTSLQVSSPESSTVSS